MTSPWNLPEPGPHVQETRLDQPCRPDADTSFDFLNPGAERDSHQIIQFFIDDPLLISDTQATDPRRPLETYNSRSRAGRGAVLGITGSSVDDLRRDFDRRGVAAQSIAHTSSQASSSAIEDEASSAIFSEDCLSVGDGFNIPSPAATSFSDHMLSRDPSAENSPVVPGISFCSFQGAGGQSHRSAPRSVPPTALSVSTDFPLFPYGSNTSPGFQGLGNWNLDQKLQTFNPFSRSYDEFPQQELFSRSGTPGPQFIDKDLIRISSKGGDWESCMTDLTVPNEPLTLLCIMCRTPSRARFSRIPKNNIVTPQDFFMDPENPMDEDEILLAAQLSRIMCRKVEVKGYSHLQRILHHHSDNPQDGELVALLKDLGSILFTLRWRYSWWMVILSDTDEERAACQARVHELCRVLYFYYCSVRRKIGSWSTAGGLHGTWSRYADTDVKVWDEFPGDETVDAFNTDATRRKFTTLAVAADEMSGAAEMSVGKTFEHQLDMLSRFGVKVRSVKRGRHDATSKTTHVRSSKLPDYTSSARKAGRGWDVCGRATCVLYSPEVTAWRGCPTARDMPLIARGTAP
ncbi:hypothetical protein Cob_v001235 [Colletotrichum orbiculare MAFF 240422]|uniref:Uncharacterized protein n=1 Tax=Colletotrichum orbiculare (strain 104-T / ATCC 96160 / CBS 514.97 / LARS 414 / MAFF 240422) TaxID=1213857 RepID=A0A484G8R7_COLOR|nr:hypothetical protein Cob_v001235 [Colletotrichum orbiculare MAFF 240422]